MPSRMFCMFIINCLHKLLIWSFLSSGSCSPCTFPCAQCTTAATTCTSCISPYSLSSSTCIICNEPCATCASSTPGTCITCKAPYLPTPDSSGACRRCNQDNCVNCQVSNSSICLSCASGSALVSGRCVLCPSIAQLVSNHLLVQSVLDARLVSN